MLLPSGSRGPLYSHGPSIDGAVWIAILPPVEKRKYVPSERCMRPGSCELLQMPLHAPGSAYARADEANRDKLAKMVANNIVFSSS